MKLAVQSGASAATTFAFLCILFAFPAKSQPGTREVNDLNTIEEQQGSRHHSCTVHTFSGTYLFLTSGYHLLSSNLDTPPPSYPFFAIGELRMGDHESGSGNAHQILSGSGQIEDKEFSTIFTLDPDEPCLGELKFTDCSKGACTDANLRLAVAADGSTAFVVAGDNSNSETGQFIRVSSRAQGGSCSKSTLRGNYLFQTSGFGFDSTIGFQTSQAYPFSSAGIVKAEDGTLSFHDWGNFAGSTTRRNYTAFYSFNSGCVADLKQTIAGAPGGRILAAADGRTFVLMQVTPDAPITGLFKRR